MLNIKYFRVQNNLTQRALGKLCGLKQQYIQQLESGKVTPTITTYEKIINAMGYKVEITRK